MQQIQKSEKVIASNPQDEIKNGNPKEKEDQILVDEKIVKDESESVRKLNAEDQLKNENQISDLEDKLKIKSKEILKLLLQACLKLIFAISVFYIS